MCIRDRDAVHLFLGEQSRDSKVSLDSSGYLKDNLTLPPSRAPHYNEEDLDTVHLSDGEQMRCSHVSLDSSGYLKDNLTLPSSRAPHSCEDLETVSLPVHTLDGMENATLRTSAGLTTDCDIGSVCPSDLAQSRQDDKGYIHEIMNSRQDADGNIGATMQSGQDGDGYIHSGLEVLSGVAKSTRDLNQCHDSDFIEEDPFCDMESDVESNFVFSDSDIKSADFTDSTRKYLT